MKRSFLLLMLAAPCAAFAQITITQADIPQAGDQWTLHVDSDGDALLAPTPGSSSAQTWDYNAPFGLTNDYSLLWAAASSVPGGTQFPGTQLGIDYGGSSSFYFADATGLYNYGSYVPLTDFTVTEDITGGVLLPTPFTYGSSRTGEQVSTSINVFTNNGPAVKSVRRNAWSITCDAFGTVQTPAYPGGTQVLRLLWDRGATVDSTFIDISGTGNGPWVFSSVSDPPGNQTYMFVQNGPMPLVIDVAAGGLSAAYYSAGQPDAIGGISSPLRQITAYPVPVQDDMLHIPLGDVGEIHTVEVLDALGVQVKRAGGNGADMLHLSTGSLSAGTYVFRCLNKSGSAIGQGRFVVAR